MTSSRRTASSSWQPPRRSRAKSEQSPPPLESVGSAGAAALLPYLQSAALATPLRKTVRAAGINVDQLRAHLAAAAGAPVPDLIKLRRMTWWTVIQAALLVLAAAAVFAAFSEVDWSEVRTELANADGGG